MLGRVKILSIDGGGIRGLIPSIILEEIEKRRKSRNRKTPFGRAFNLMAGTSTGTLITLGLSVPKAKEGRDRLVPRYSIEDIVEMFEDRGLDIFPRSIFNGLQTVRQAFTEKYDAGFYEQILQETFMDFTVQEGTTNLIVTSYDIERSRPLIIKKRPGKKGKEDPDFYMRDAARGSSAAPTYFIPVPINPLNSDEEYCLLDGALFAANPAMCAYIEARKIFPWSRKIFILSLGTGIPTKRYTYQQMKSWGYLEWVLPSQGSPISSIMVRGQSECVNYQLHHLPGVEYIRINPSLDDCSHAIDDASETNLQCLRKVASKTIEENDTLIDYLASRI